MNPRIYTYKVTFPHQGWWYWGVHKEKRFGESYSGSPETHKDKWDWFEFEIQILEFFDDWDEARAVERRLIRPDINNPMCLNENEGGAFSLGALTKGGESAGKIAVESGQLASVQSKGGKVGGKINGPIQGRKNVESGLLQYIASEGGKIGGKVQGRRNVESGQLASIQSEGGKAASKITNSQKWKCLVTGEILPPGPLSCYQRARGIDKSLRERVE